MIKNINKYIISKNKNVKDALKIIDKNGEKTCFVVDEKRKLLGSLTDGDIRRNILKQKKDKGETVYKLCNKKTKYLLQSQIKTNKIKNLFIKKRIEIIPILNNENDKKIIGVILKSKNFGIKKKISGKNNTLFKTNVVIMAGGKGKRLDPITRVLPKPLVPLKGKTAIENIIDSFTKFGSKKFFLMLNFKSDLIKAYINNIPRIKKKISYVNELKPLGTVGGLEKLKGKVTKNFLVSNCDVVFEFDFKNLIQSHIKNKSDLTLVTSNQTSLIPYGVCKINSNKELLKIEEKPKYNHLITTGLYVFNSNILRFIPKNKYMDMNNFIEILKKNKLKIGTFKIGQKQWYDIGQLHEYKKRLETLRV